MIHFTGHWLAAACAGGLVLGAATMAKLATNGTILGVSGIVGGLFDSMAKPSDAVWRLVFTAGLILAGALLRTAEPETLQPLPTTMGWARVCVAGALVGFGSSLANGCTSGHGISGLTRLSPRSVVATGVFMACAVLSASLSTATDFFDDEARPTPTFAVGELLLAAAVLVATLGALCAGVARCTKTADPTQDPSPPPGNNPARLLVELFTGTAFGLGLGISGMGQPIKVLGFLDLHEAWDPTLAFVMGSALCLTLPTFHCYIKHSIPALDTCLRLPAKTKIDAMLVCGSAMFGIGWGLAGVCPGPALIGIFAPENFWDSRNGAFVLSMLCGMLANKLTQLLFRRLGLGAAVCPSGEPEPEPKDASADIIQATDEVHLCGDLSADALQTAAAKYQSWIYLNPEVKAEESGAKPAALSAGVSFNCVEVDKSSLTLELSQRVVAALEAAPKPCLIQCSTATRAGTVLLLTLARQRGLNFAAAMQLALDMRLKFVGDFSFDKGDAKNALVSWVEVALADSVLRSPDPAKLQVKQLFDEESSTYTYLLADLNTKHAVLIDPVLEQVDRDLAVVDEAGLNLRYAVNTHAHADHITGSGRIKSLRPDVQSVISDCSRAAADIKLQDGESLRFGDQQLKALATPGHTAGCLSYYLADAGLLFTGDTLLIRGCGRTDFQEGSSATLYGSVRSVLFELPPETTVAPAHDYKGRNLSSIGDEIRYNPRLGGVQGEGDFVKLMSELNLPYPKKLDVAVPANMQCGVY